MTSEELKQIIKNHEHEKVELKEWKGTIPFEGKNQFAHRKCLLGYCVALGNEGGGKLIIGVNNKGQIVGTSASLPNNAKKKIYDSTGQKIGIQEVCENQKRIIVIDIPTRPIGTLLKFAGIPLMRIGESLEVMSDDIQRQILFEGQNDFSARICEDSSIEAIDPEALSELKAFYKEKHHNNKEVSVLSDEQFLSDISLMEEGRLNYAGVILLAKKSFLDKRLSNVEISFEYRNTNTNLQFNERIDYREPFILSISKIWKKILSRQQTYSFIDGLFRRDILAFNEEVF